MKQTYRHNQWYLIAWLLLLGLMPALASAQQPTLEEVLQRAEAAGVSMEQVETIRERATQRGIPDEGIAGMLLPAVEMAERDLPSDLVLGKAREGLAKNVPPARMNPVLQQIRQASEQTLPLVDDWMSRPEVGQMLEREGERFNREQFRREMLRVSSRAVSGQVGTELVAEIMETLVSEGVVQNASPGKMIAAVHILPDLPGVGERPDHARQMIEQAVRGGFDARDLQQLPGAMQMAQRRSQLPGEAVMEGVGRQMGQGTPASEILQNLFEGRIGGGPPGHAPGGLEERPGRSGDQGNRPGGGRP